MVKKILRIILAALAVTAWSSVATNAWAQAVTVVEYYNKALDAYFITGRSSEQQQLDVIPNFQRTGMTFQAVAASASAADMTRVCRFYVNTASPYANSHFYGLESTECEPLLMENLPGFNWEGYDFALRQPTNGACPSGSTTIYRSFRSAAGGKTANHRYSASATSYAAIADAGYNAEQATFCATAATDVAVATQADCGALYFSRVRLGYQSLSDDGKSERWVRAYGSSTITFNGQTVQPIIDQYASGATSTTMIDDAAPDTWTEIGTRSQSNNGTVESYFVNVTVFPRRMSAGQSMDFDRYVAFSPTQPFGSPRQEGNLKLVGREVVNVATGAYAACKLQRDITSNDVAGRTTYSNTTFWVAPSVGIIKSKTIETVVDGFGPSYPSRTTDASLVAVERF